MTEMIAKVGTTCLICKKPIRKQSKPFWVFDLDKAELKGLAHETCVNDADELDYSMVKQAEWNETSPSKEEIEFGCKIAKTMKEVNELVDSAKVYPFLILHACQWKTRNVDECLQSDEVKRLLDQWVNRSKIMSLEDAENIKQFIKDKLGEREKHA